MYTAHLLLVAALATLPARAVAPPSPTAPPAPDANPSPAATSAPDETLRVDWSNTRGHPAGMLHLCAARTAAAYGPRGVADSGPDWPMFRGCPQMTGVAGSTLPETLAVRWRCDLGAPIASTAAIADGAAYVGTDNGELVALALADGTRRWTWTGPDGIQSSPTIIGDLVLFGDEGGVLHACDRGTGTQRWSFTAGGRIVSSVNWRAERLVFGSYDQHVYCLRLPGGELLWKYAVGERVHATPAVVGDTVLFAACDGDLHVVDLRDGRPRARVALDSVSGAAAAALGPRVFVGTYGQRVLAVNWLVGDVAWQFADAQRSFPFLSSAAVTPAAVVIGGQDKRLQALDPTTGTQLWEFATRGRVDGSPVVVYSADTLAGGAGFGGRPAARVFCGSADGNLYALDLATGREVWRFAAGGSISASPAVGESTLVIGTDEGVLYCFGGT